MEAWLSWRPASEGGPYTITPDKSRRRFRGRHDRYGGLQFLVGGLGCGELQGDLVGDADAVAFQGDDFLGVIGDDADIREAEVDQDLRANAAFVLHHALAGRLAVELAAGMKMNLRQGSGSFRHINGVAAPGVVEIEKYAAIFLGNFFQRTRHKLRAIASG